MSLSEPDTYHCGAISTVESATTIRRAGILETWLQAHALS
jgi:hypothetical protein